MEHIGYSIFYLFIYLFLYRGLEVGGGGVGQRRRIMGYLQMANWQYMYMWFTLAESSKSLIQGRTKPIVPL